MLAATKIPVFRSRSRAPLVSVEELWRFARFVGDLQSQEITVEGVEFARSLGDGATQLTFAPMTADGVYREINISPPPKHQYHFDRSRGALLSAELDAYETFLAAALPARNDLRSNSIRDTRRQAETPFKMALA